METYAYFITRETSYMLYDLIVEPQHERIFEIDTLDVII